MQLTENTRATEVGVSCSKAISTVWAPSQETRTVSIGIENLDVIVDSVSLVDQRSQELEDRQRHMAQIMGEYSIVTCILCTAVLLN